MALQLSLECLLTQLGFDPLLGIHFLEAGVLLFLLGQPLGFPGLNSALLLFPAVTSRLVDPNGATDIVNGLALGDQPLSG